MGQINTTTTRFALSDALCESIHRPSPGLLVAHAPPHAGGKDRYEFDSTAVVGRDDCCDCTLDDHTVSAAHFRIVVQEQTPWIEDLDSTNGTFVNGRPIHRCTALKSPSVIRAGRTLLVFHRDVSQLLRMPTETHGFVGPFHSGGILESLELAAQTPRHIILAGPTGTGKELAARALFRMMVPGDHPFCASNAACMASFEIAAPTLFGVAHGAFTNVAPRIGLIEQAHGGVLFLDEVHNLPERIQRSLLRVIENGQFNRIGESRPRTSRVRFIFASNAPGPSYSLAHDILARLHVVQIPTLLQRIADIPAIFDFALEQALHRTGHTSSSLDAALTVELYEALCLDGFKRHNVRGIIDLASRIAARFSRGESPSRAVARAFHESRSPGGIDHRSSVSADTAPNRGGQHQRHRSTPVLFSGVDPHRDFRISGDHIKHLIVDLYFEHEGNIAQVKKLLDEQNIRISRQRLAALAEEWNLPTKRALKKKRRA